MRLLISTAIHFCCVLALDFRMSFGTLEVSDKNENFLPLCASSYKEEFGDKACEKENRGPPSSLSFSALSSPPTLSVACTTANCFAFAANYCRDIVKLECEEKVCQEGDIQLTTKCVHIGHTKLSGYSNISEYCNGRVLSIEEPDDLTEIVSQIDSHITYFTSGVRIGSSWKWENGKEIEMKSSPSGSGRCLGLFSGTFSAIDCDIPTVPLCERGLECVGNGKVYEGTANRTLNGFPCLNWSSPSIVYQNTVVSPQWDHNFCRFFSNSSLPVCFSSFSTLSPCSIPSCPTKAHDHNGIEGSPCSSSDSVQCGQSSQCVHRDFLCDYEVDCDNGFDEKNCKDFLQNFELIGAYKLIDKVTEIWANIPHVQGCARRCEESDLLCESFTYESRSFLCLLTDSIDTQILVPRATSQYYTRRFSTREISYRLNSTVVEAEKGGVWAPVCNENQPDEQANIVCNVFGFGISIPSSPSISSLSLSSPSNYWSLECLRREKCLTTVHRECTPLRCSHCQSGVCGDGECIERRQLCDGRRDCRDNSDERRCEDLVFRLSGGSDETRGTVEVHFGGKWEGVCGEEMEQTVADSLCKMMEMGTPARLLSPSQNRLTGWRLSCTNTLSSKCRLIDLATCQHANLKCAQGKPNPSITCGVRDIEVPARDMLKGRLARVVGGFTTIAGAFPWSASVRIRNGGAHHCGATVISHTHLLTAAHCFDDDRRPSTYEIIVGDYDNNITEGHEQIFNMTRFHFYPLYQDLFAHDIAIIEIPSPGIRYDTYAKPICLPPRDFQYTTGRKCVVSGWGSIGLSYPDRLQAALVPIIDREKCRNSSKIYESMSNSAFCAGYLTGGVDSCQGDSGGPMGCQDGNGIFYLAGVISWGDGCAMKNQPGIYTMVAPYLSWIENIIKTRVI